MPAPFCGLCWNCPRKPDVCSYPSRLPTCCQSDVFKAQTLSGHSCQPQDLLALRIKSCLCRVTPGSSVCSCNLISCPTLPRHLGLPQFCKHTSSFLPQGLWTCCSHCQEHSVQASSSFLRFQLRCQFLEEPFPAPQMRSGSRVPLLLSVT